MGISRSYVLGWLGLSLGVSIVAASFNVPTLWRVTHDGATTTGAVLAIDLTNHQQVRYSYKVGSSSYSGIDHLDAGSPVTATDLSPGSPVVVHYARSAPALSTLGMPGSRLRNELIAVFLFPALVAVGLLLKGLRPNKSFKPNPLRGSA